MTMDSSGRLQADACRLQRASPQLHAAKKYPISKAAVSGASEPCVALRSMDVPKSLRSVPASAFAGSVAPIAVRHLLDGVGRFERQHARRGPTT